MDRLNEEVRAARAAAEDPTLSAIDRADMLMEIAMGLQRSPSSIEYLGSAIELYDRALALCPPDERILWARITARRATALQAIPGEDTEHLEAARDGYRHAIRVFSEFGSPEEVAEAEMNQGLVLQALAASRRARITDAISAYQRALRTFDRDRFPREFAIIQNNLATAFLSIPFTDERGKLCEALAVQAFEEGLKIVSLVDYPIEYAMLQNNLGNALQYASSSHVLENNLRALAAYDEALKVRTRATMPLEYANTISNKANCLWNLPDDVRRRRSDGAHDLHRARAYYGEAREIFTAHGERHKARVAGQSCDQIDRELLAAREVAERLEPAEARAVP
jgi:tetratricopeptide (TPR) repeat protein